MAMIQWSASRISLPENTRSRACIWATSSDWDDHKELIGRLYEEQSLPKVMHIMETQYGFKATTLMETSRIKMYKTRFKSWGLNKKKQQHEVRALALKEKQRRRATLVIATPAKVARADRCGLVCSDYIDGSRTASEPRMRISECFTTIPTSSTTPGLLGIPERIFYTIRDYYRGSFESGIWVSNQDGFNCYTVKTGPKGTPIENPVEYLTALNHQCSLACKLFADGNCEEAGQALMLATAGIKEILLGEHPETLNLLFDLVRYVQRKGRQEIALAILRQFSALAEVLLGHEHPLRQICGWLASAEPTSFEEVVVTSLRSACEHFECYLGPMHQLTVVSYLTYIEEAYRHTDVNQEEVLQRNLLDKCECLLGAHDSRTLEVRLALASHYYFVREADLNARKMAQDVVTYAHRARSASYQIYLRTRGLYVLAISQYELGEMISAEANLREAILLHISKWGTADGKARSWLVTLEKWLVKRGEFRSVSQLKAWRKAMMKPLDDNEGTCHD